MESGVIVAIICDGRSLFIIWFIWLNDNNC
jgi:hypothetical protein